MGGDRRSRRPEHRAVVAESLARQPDLTLQEMRNALAGHGFTIGIASLWRFLKAQNITFKKESPCRRTGSARPSRNFRRKMT
jgi:transposase